MNSSGSPRDSVARDDVGEQSTRDDLSSYKDLITYVADRPGHDQRYAIDASKIQKDLGWVTAETSKLGLEKLLSGIWIIQSGVSTSKTVVISASAWVCSQ